MRSGLAEETKALITVLGTAVSFSREALHYCPRSETHVYSCAYRRAEISYYNPMVEKSGSSLE